MRCAYVRCFGGTFIRSGYAREPLAKGITNFLPMSNAHVPCQRRRYIFRLNMAEKRRTDSPARQHPRSKIHRVGVACNACKERKTKCDGERPSKCKTVGKRILLIIDTACLACSMRGLAESCNYRQVESKAGELPVSQADEPRVLLSSGQSRALEVRRQSNS